MELDEESGRTIAYEERLNRLVDLLFDFGFGTVWCIREDLWQEMAPQYDQQSTRSWHPGVSTRRGGALALYEAFPVLHGSSHPGPVPVKGLTKERGEDHIAYFGRFIFPTFLNVAEVASADSSDRSKTHGYWFEHSRAVANVHKPRLSEAEMDQLETWLTNMELLEA